MPQEIKNLFSIVRAPSVAVRNEHGSAFRLAHDKLRDWLQGAKSARKHQPIRKCVQLSSANAAVTFQVRRQILSESVLVGAEQQHEAVGDAV
jgi:hypothetical protein